MENEIKKIKGEEKKEKQHKKETGKWKDIF